MFSIGDRVQRKYDGKVGIIKSTINYSEGLRYQVQLENGPTVSVPEDQIVLFEEIPSEIELFQNGQFYSIDYFKRILSYQRVMGDLTNMFYSMNNTLTDYWPHQFLPVTKFLQSPEERILIADEVGLGKTIEAMYIWKEVEARRNAKRLLVVCPAALKIKWQRDMENLFGINAKIVKVDEIANSFESIKKNHHKEQFAYICSMESIRAKHTEGFKKTERLNYEFEEYAANSSFSAFDLVIIDEAHYLRNRETANFKTASRLRDISDSMVLLSATPIQTASDNLFSIMNILAPEQYDNENTFRYMLERESVFVKLANCLQRNSATKEEFFEILNENSFNSKIKNNDLIEEIKSKSDFLFDSEKSIPERMDYAEQLRRLVFYNNIFNRSRRRFVFTDNTVRRAEAVHFELQETEKEIYDRVTKTIRQMAAGQDQLLTFALIARQRQMASCLPAAFREWKEKYKGTFPSEVNEEDYDETMLGDIVVSDELDEDDKKVKTDYQDLNPFYQIINEEYPHIHFEDLKKHDSKYNSFSKHIKSILKDKPEEKIIVFSFFRGTNDYLAERLEEDGIHSVAIKGGMGALKDEYLEEFRDNPSINVLVSSEVGSEGLDLQFAHIEYNYDLPWNPMRLEQRIGRIDRLGQKSKVLQIFNISCSNTIEDQILEKLYLRVKIFQDSIGDMEDIVGQPIQDLALEIMNPELTDEERNDKAMQKIQALEQQRMNNQRLEEESGLLEQYRDMVLSSIKKAKINKRCLSGEELRFVIRDFLANYFPGCTFTVSPTDPKYSAISLNPAAINSFDEFRKATGMTKRTDISTTARKEVLLGFGITKDEKIKRYSEIVDIDHPIFDWIKYMLRKSPAKNFGCSAITMAPVENLIQEGQYVYYIQKWVKTGAEKLTELKYFLCNVDTREIFDNDISEAILNEAITEAATLENPIVRLREFDKYLEAQEKNINHAFDEAEVFIEEHNKHNKYQIQKQIDFVNYTADRKIKDIQEKIAEENDKEKPNKGVIHRFENRAGKINRERSIKIDLLEKSKNIEPDIISLATGVLFVE